MALINCPDCGKPFSDKASACPNCGAPSESKTRQAEEVPKKKGGKLKYIIITILVLAVLGALMGKEEKGKAPSSADSRQETADPGKQSPGDAKKDTAKQAEKQEQLAAEIELVKGLPRLNAGAILQAYLANEVAADAQYKRKEVSIWGQVKKIEKSLGGSPQISLVGLNAFNDVKITLEDSQMEIAAKLQVGMTVNVRAVVTGMTLGSVFLKDGIIYDPKRPETGVRDAAKKGLLLQWIEGNT